MNNNLRQIAVINESECIGCTKCIAVCPVDAILGAEKLMHTVIADECIGCQLCIAPCPVDCIELMTDNHYSQEKTLRAKQRFQAHKQRIAKKQVINPPPTNKDYFAQLLARAKAK